MSLTGTNELSIGMPFLVCELQCSNSLYTPSPLMSSALRGPQGPCSYSRCPGSRHSRSCRRVPARPHRWSLPPSLSGSLSCGRRPLCRPGRLPSTYWAALHIGGACEAIGATQLPCLFQCRCAVEGHALRTLDAASSNQFTSSTREGVADGVPYEGCCYSRCCPTGQVQQNWPDSRCQRRRAAPPERGAR